MMRRRHQIVLWFLLLQMSEFAIHPLAAALHKVLAQRMIRLIVVANLESIENVRWQFTGCSKTLLLTLRTMEKLAARPITFAVLEIVAEGIFLHGIVLGTLVKVLAALPPMTDISQKVSADPVRGIDSVSRVHVQSTRHPDRLLMRRSCCSTAFQLYLQFFHRWHIAIARRRRCTFDELTKRG